MHEEQKLPDNQPLFRYISLQDFMWLMTCRKSTFRLPTQWPDPYEGYLFKTIANKEHGPSVIEALLNHPEAIKEKVYECINKLFFAQQYTYAQCWTHSENDNDAMWRIYLYDKTTVRIETSWEELREIVEKSLDSKRYKVHIGNVSYDLNKYASPADFVTKHIVNNECRTFDTLLSKREAFAHEQETRILVTDEKYYNLHRLFVILNIEGNSRLKNTDNAKALYDFIMDQKPYDEADEIEQSIDVVCPDISWIHAALLTPLASQETCRKFFSFCETIGMPSSKFSKSKLYKLPWDRTAAETQATNN